jgi:Xaa-Pro aminopeptidase
MKNVHQIHRERRSALLRQMRAQSGGGLALVPTAPELARNRDSLFPYRHDSYFHYVSGFPEPEAVVALVTGRDGPASDRHILFCRDKNEDREIWDGFRYGPDAARGSSASTSASDRGARQDAARSRCRPACAVHADRAFAPWDRKIADVLNEVRNRVSVSPPESSMSGGARCAAPRERRARAEADAPRRDLCRRASPGDGPHTRRLVRISGGGRAHRISRPAQAVAYPSIVAAVECLRAALPRQQPAAADGELLLIDAAAVPGYARRHAHVSVNEVYGPQAVYEWCSRHSSVHRRCQAGCEFTTTTKSPSACWRRLPRWSRHTPTQAEAAASTVPMHRAGHWLAWTSTPASIR